MGFVADTQKMHPCGAHGRDKRRPSPLEGFHGSREKDHSTELRIISERVVVEGVILTCRTPLLRRWEITRREKEERGPTYVEARWEEERDDDTGRRTRGNETTRGPLGGGWQGVKDRPGVGEDQTSRRATGWSLPALLRVSSFSSAAAYQECLALLVSLFFSFLDAVALASQPAVLLALILFIFPRSCSSTMWFDDLRSRRSSLSLLPYDRTRNRPRCLAKLFDGKLHRQPADLPFWNGLRRSWEIFCRVLS